MPRQHHTSQRGTGKPLWLASDDHQQRAHPERFMFYSLCFATSPRPKCVKFPNEPTRATKRHTSTTKATGTNPPEPAATRQHAPKRDLRGLSPSVAPHIDTPLHPAQIPIGISQLDFGELSRAAIGNHINGGRS